MIAALVGLTLSLVMAPKADAADPALIEAAKKEGELTVYGCDPGQTPVYIEAFKKLYPEINVTSYLAGCWQIYNRHVTERGAGKQVADVFFSLEDVLTRMQSEQLLTPYKSPELANFPAMAAPEGKNYSLVKVLILGMAANKDFVKDMPLPRDWFDFASPKPEWRDMITFYDPRTSSAAFSLLALLYQNFGEEKTAAIYQGLVKSGAELAPTTPAGMSKLLSGEKPLMFYIVNNHYSGAVAKGAPIEFIVPKSGTVALPFAVSVLDGAPHSAAAKLFADFMLNEVQVIVQKANEYALKNGSQPPQGMPALDSVKLLPLDVGKALADQEQLIAWWQKTTGIR
ncbi:iron(III) transport system substrate-binding protein [Rhodoligotrophos appendicifer]|uniref:ABC transporter substrate-binding protein n=1 Tax=Rhodoligotrophos appendicifer TaxID=987056 RepID=UPI0014782C09|nr:extracellular solute-binding protein [Rhodoligotrophos appendicifer]